MPHPALLRLLLAAGLALLPILLLLPLQVWAAAGTVQAAVGSVRIIQANGQERAAIKGDHLYAGDTVTTGAGSNAQIRLIDDARVWLRPQTRYRIEQYPGDAASAAQPQAQAATRLIEGSLRTVTGAIGQAAPERYTLKTPNAVIAIRGTDFEVAHFGPGLAAQMQAAPGTYHRVFQGQTQLSSPGSPPLNLRTGQAAYISLEPGAAPRSLPQIPPFLDLPPPGAPPAGAGAPGARDASGPNAAGTREPPGAAAPRSLRLGLRLASALADGATVVASAGAPVEPVEQFTRAREGQTVRLSVLLPAPPNSRQRRAPEPPMPFTLDLHARLEGNQAIVQVQSPQTGAAATITLPVGRWVDISGRQAWQTGDRQVISSSMARPESAQILIRVDPGE